jgi:protein TonB
MIVALHVGLGLLFAHASRPTVAPKPLPVRLLTDFIEPPQAAAPPPMRVEPQPRTPKQEPKRERPQPPQPEVPPAAAETSTASLVQAAPAPSPPTLHTLPVAAAPAPPPPAPPAPPRVELPSTDADYLQNPKPVYPPLSKRLNEQGTVLIRVLVGADGLPQQARVARSSGYERLDQAALAAVQAWRFVPGKRAGVPEAMWFDVPISFVLQ